MPPGLVRLDDPRFRIIIVNNVPYLDLQTMGSGASSTVCKVGLLVPYGYELEMQQKDPWKPPSPAFNADKDGNPHLVIYPREQEPRSPSQDPGDTTGSPPHTGDRDHTSTETAGTGSREPLPGPGTPDSTMDNYNDYDLPAARLAEAMRPDEEDLVPALPPSAGTSIDELRMRR